MILSHTASLVPTEHLRIYNEVTLPAIMMHPSDSEGSSSVCLLCAVLQAYTHVKINTKSNKVSPEYEYITTAFPIYTIYNNHVIFNNVNNIFYDNNDVIIHQSQGIF